MAGKPEKPKIVVAPKEPDNDRLLIPVKSLVNWEPDAKLKEEINDALRPYRPQHLRR